uniref:Zinc transporter zip13-like protein n=1 Tax=Triatoma infestans TaxID=30076 RepID=A0A170TVG7_TRIIF
MEFQTQQESFQFDFSNTSDSEIWFRNLFQSVNSFSSLDYNPWVGSVIGSVIVGLSGIFPLLVIPIDGGVNITKGVNGDRLKLLLSFAVVGLLGDVFLHLLPEAWDVTE